MLLSRTGIILTLLSSLLVSASTYANWNLLSSTMQQWGTICSASPALTTEEKSQCVRLEAISREFNFDYSIATGQTCPSPQSYIQGVNWDAITVNAKSFLDTLGSASEKLKNWNPKDIYEMIKCIENNKQIWKDQCINEASWQKHLPDQPLHRSSYRCDYFENPNDQKTHVTLVVDFDEKCERIFISNIGETLGEGNYKRFEGALEYKEWNSVARGAAIPEKLEQLRLTNPARYQYEMAELRKEIRILKDINQLPAQQQIGLPQTFYADELRIIQTKYDSDLSKSTITAPSAKFRVISQLSRGLTNLHAIGLVHSDYKPQNIMGSDLNNAAQARVVISDFGLSYRPADFVGSGRNKPVAGTPSYMAPEQGRGFIGKTPQEKIENAQKGDIFAHALVILEKTTDFSSKSAFNAFKICNTRFHMSSFQHLFHPGCAKELQILRTEVAQSKNNPLSSLLEMSLDPDPRNRPTSAEFQQRSDAALTTEVYNKATQYFKSSSLLNLKKYQFKKHFINISTIAAASHTDGQKWPFADTEYKIYPIVDPLSGNPTMRMLFRKSDGTMGVRKLNADPYHPNTVRDEVRALKKREGIK